MSLQFARWQRRQPVIELSALTCKIAAAVALASPFSFAQENVLRDSSSPPAIGSGLKIAVEKNESSTPNSAKPSLADQSTGEKTTASDPATRSESGAKPKRDPLVLPPLGTPNISIKGLGTGATPEDMVQGRMPSRRELPFGEERYGFWTLGYKTWTAPVFCHQPTYFEDVMLERHGHERCPPLQPLLSGVRFYSDIALMPYNAYLNPPLKDISSAGYYRPGSSVAGLRQRPTYDKGAIRFQLLTTGTAVLAAQP